jgi:phage regulator Rha-like protein
MNDLVKIKRIDGTEEIFTDSLIIAKGTENQHDSILSLISKYKSEFSQLGNIRFTDLKSENSKGGRPIKLFLLNEIQATFLMTLLRNNKVVVRFKLALTKEFYRMRELIREKLSSEWQETRIKGKMARRDETDVIMNKLIPLAILQGSKNAGKLYMTYSKLVNDCVGIPAKSRDKATKRVLDVIYNLENLIEHVISEEVEKGTYYKDIYQICKGKCRLLAELSYLPEQRLIA